jgi:hypothetical protein
MKIIINTSFGGFGFSTEAVKVLIERCARCIKRMPIAKYRRRSETDLRKARDVGDGYQIDGSMEHILYKKGIVFYVDEEDSRTDPVAVEIVEMMGNAADGAYASLRVVEIPDNVKYTIEEYDGAEHVAEEHRTWR